MKEYLSNLIPRIKEFSASLDRKEVFIDKPWVWVDENNDQQKLIFKRNGELIMSFNGRVTLGSWEYIKAAQSLLLDRIQDKILLNQAFIDEAVMVLKQDGLKGDKLILINEILIPDLNVDGYLKKLFYDKNSVQVSKLNTGQSLEIHQVYYANEITNKPVTIDLKEANDGRYVTSKGNIAVVKSGTLENIYTRQTRKLKNGMRVVVENPIFNNELFPINSLIYDGDAKTPLPDGKYAYKSLRNIKVKNGRIVNTSLF